MNDDLLQSRKRERQLENLLISKGESSDQQMKVTRSPTKNSIAVRILGIERQAKINVIFNNFCAVLLFTVIPLGVILSTFGNFRWFIMAENAKYTYWVNLLFIKKRFADNQISPDGSPSVYFYWMFSFYYGGCSEGTLTSDDPVGLCSVLTPYYYSGVVASIAIAVGLIFHVIHLWQLARITLNRKSHQIKAFSPMMITYIVIFVYSGSLIYWLFASSSLFSKDTSGRSIFSRFGSSFYCYLGAIIFFIVLTIWFRKVYKKGVRRAEVNTLLNAENRYNEDLENDSNIEEIQR